MENEEKDVNLQSDTEVTENTNEESVESTETEETRDIDAEIKKATAPLYARMKQAEAEAKEAKAKLANSSKSETKVSGDITQLDVIYLAKADIHEDDMSEVLKYASNNKVSVKDAHNYLKPILDVRKEQRSTANAANTTSSKRGSGKASDEAILESARAGKATDPEALAKARFAEKMKGIN